MIQIRLFILILMISGCSLTSKLNQKIDLSQRDCLKNSPFNTAKGVVAELNAQLKYRRFYDNDLDSLIKTYSKDTIILTENYDYICLGCQADYVQIFIDNSLFTYTYQYDLRKYQKTKDILSVDYVDSRDIKHNDINEIKKELSKDSAWNCKPEKYGTDKCFDGGHTFYTIIYPNGKIESMYMRCWLDKEMRDKYN